MSLIQAGFFTINAHIGYKVLGAVDIGIWKRQSLARGKAISL